MKKIIALILILTTLSLALTGCWFDKEERTVSSSEPEAKTTTKTTSSTSTKTSSSNFDDAVADCENSDDKNSCYVTAVEKYKYQVTEQNVYTYVNVCKQVIVGDENPDFVASKFDWEIYPTQRMQCFRSLGEPFLSYGKVDFVAKEWCDELEGNDISSGESYRDYCYIEVADARKIDDTQQAEELCYTMDDTLMRMHCCETVYGKYNNQADYCTKVRV